MLYSLVFWLEWSVICVNEEAVYWLHEGLTHTQNFTILLNSLAWFKELLPWVLYTKHYHQVGELYLVFFAETILSPQFFVDCVQTKGNKHEILYQMYASLEIHA